MHSFDDIRRRWHAARWQYQQSTDHALLYTGDGGSTIQVHSPTNMECATLELAARAPDDIRALVAEIMRLRGLYNEELAQAQRNLLAQLQAEKECNNLRRELEQWQQATAEMTAAWVDAQNNREAP